MKGGALKSNLIKKFLENSYKNVKDADTTIGNYTLDKKLSNTYVKIYYSPKKLIIIHRGTKEAMDWTNNVIYANNTQFYKMTPRYKTAEKTQKKAINKYPHHETYLLGHSQGGILVHLLNNDDIHNAISYNPGSKAESIKNNEFIIRSTYDVVSGFSTINKLLKPNNIIEIKSDNVYDVLKNHGLDELDKLNNRLIGT